MHGYTVIILIHFFVKRCCVKCDSMLYLCHKQTVNAMKVNKMDTCTIYQAYEKEWNARGLDPFAMDFNFQRSMTFYEASIDFEEGFVEFTFVFPFDGHGVVEVPKRFKLA